MFSLTHREAPSTGEKLAMVIAVLLFASLSIWQAIASEGFLEADGCTHYMYARWAFEYPVYFVDIWGRPFKTALYAPAAAAAGLIGVRLTSLVVAIATAFIAYMIARGQRFRWPALALIFTLAQPLVFLHSFSELTELPFAMLLGLAFLAYQRRRLGIMTLLAGLLPLSRPEGFGFILLTAVLLLYHRRWGLLPVLAMPVMGWQIAGAMLYREPQHWWNWLPRHWPYAGESLYPRGPIWHFAALLPAVVGPALFPFALIGAWKSLFVAPESNDAAMAWREEARGLSGSHVGEVAETTSSDNEIGVIRSFISSHRVRVQILIAVIPLMIFAGHSALYALGKMASNGELRYLLIVAPFWALLTAKGWEWVWERFIRKYEVAEINDVASTHSSYTIQPASFKGWRSPFRYAAVAALAPILANHGYKVLPLVQTEDWKAAARIAHWYQTSGVADDYPYIMAAHPGVAYALDWPTLDPRLREWNRENVQTVPKGTVGVWDLVYAVHNADRRKSVDSFDASPTPPRKWIADWKAGKLLCLGSFDDPFVFWSLSVSDRKIDGSMTPIRVVPGDRARVERDW